ncbi:MAG: hydroxymethylglutaryl-CoA lyase [Candidatus Binatia bacterium]
MGRRVYIQEVAPRDGFQAESMFIETGRKVALIDALSRCGLAKIEVTSFTSPRAIPALRDAEDVMARITRVPGVSYTVLVPNVRGGERAAACRPDEFNLVMSASEAHNASNLRLTREQSFSELERVIALAHAHGIAVNVSLSCSFGCPFEGDVPADAVLDWCRRFAELGVAGMSLCDTTGMAYPTQVRALCSEFRSRFPAVQLTLHVHNTRGMGLANALEALAAGVDRFDASLGGLGGCPYAPGATGNVCTEDLVHMLDLIGCATGVDLPALLDCSRQLPALVGHDVPGQVVKAGRRLDPPRAATA